MTESEWLATDDFHGMGVALWQRGPVSRRKLLLFLHARCVRLQVLAPDERLVAALALFGQHPDVPLARRQVRRLADEVADWAAVDPTPPAKELDAAVGALRRVRRAPHFAWSLFPVRERDSRHLMHPHYYQPSVLAERPELPPALQAAWLRDLFGNPFAPCVVTPEQANAWLQADGGTAAGLLAAIAAAGRFADLPILADALEEGGCDAADLLGHLRGETPHVPGCWAIDLLTGQS